MKKRKFPIVLVLGLVLIGIALSMFLGLQIRVRIGAGRSQATAEKLKALLPERSVGIPGLYANPSMPALQIDGVDYVGLLEVPALAISLPVAGSWNRDKLFDAPARFYGNAYNRALVIGGMDYAHQFAFCDQIDTGVAIVFTDMTGTRFSYTVDRVERSKSAQSDWLINTECDLTLFCQDTYSMEYIAVRCTFAGGA